MIAAAASRVSALFGSAEPATEVELATAFDLLRNERRRLTIRKVAELYPGQRIHVRDLAHEIAAVEQDAEPAELSFTESKSAYVALLDSHLPKLAAADVVVVEEDDRSRRTVGRGAALEGFVEFLDESEAYFVAGDAR